jgi:hypothetical protein
MAWCRGIQHLRQEADRAITNAIDAHVEAERSRDYDDAGGEGGAPDPGSRLRTSLAAVIVAD